MSELQTLKASVDALEAGDVSESHFQKVIDSVKGSNEQKILACLTLPVYFSKFPSLQDAALNAYLDLLEDSEQSIRIKSITQMKVLAANNPTLVPRLADVLTQLFASDEPADSSQVHASFDALFKLDAVNCLIVLINQIYAGDEKTRKEALEYATSQLRKRGGHIPQSIASASPALQAELANKVKTCFTRTEQLSINEFKQLFTFLLSLKFLHSDPNYETDLTAILHNQSINHTFDPKKDTTIDGWLGATRCIQATKQHPVDRAPFMKYFTTQIAPAFSQLTDQQRLHISRSLPSVAQSNTRTVDNHTLRSFLEAVWNIAQPLCPATSHESFAANEASRTRFSLLEGLLVACHLVAAQSLDAAKHVLGLFVPTGQPGEGAAEAKKVTTTARMTALIAGMKSWSTNIKAEITAAQAASKAATDDESKKTAGAKVGLCKSDFRVCESLSKLASAFNEKLPTFINDGAASWRRESKDSAKEKRDNQRDSKQTKGNQTKDGGNKNTKGQQTQSGNQSNKRKNDNQNDNSNKKRKGDNQQQQQQQQPQSKKQRNAPSPPANQPAFNVPMMPNMAGMNMAAMNPMMMAAYMASMQQQFFQQAQQQQQQQPSGRGKQQNNQNNQNNNQGQRPGGQQGGRKRGRQ